MIIWLITLFMMILVGLFICSLFHIIRFLKEIDKDEEEL